MATVAIFPEIDKMLTCTAALDKAYELACAKLPETEHARLAKALALVQSGGVFETDHGYWEVASQSEGGEPHAVNGSCDCDWRHFHPAERCTHMLAVALQKKTMQLLTASAQAETGDPIGEGDVVDLMPLEEPVMQTQTVPPAPVPVPEALFSATLKGTVGGHETLLTVRGMTAAEFTANLQAVRGVLDKPARPTPLPSTPKADETPQCSTHGALKRSTKGKGWYCPHKLDDETWC